MVSQSIYSKREGNRIMKLHAACMTMNEASDLILNLESILPYVDSMTVVDNGSSDLTIFYLRNWAKNEPKLRLFLHSWEDDFPKARNNYVKHVSEIASTGDWLLTFDADEYFDTVALEKMRSAINLAEKNDKNMIGFQCRSVTLEGPKRVWENVDDYWKHLLIKWDQNFHYTGYKCHEGKGGVPHNIMNTALIYEHRKQADITWIRGMRNSIVGGSGDNLGDSCPNFVEAKRVLKSLGISGWHELYDYLLKGNVDQTLKDFMVGLMLEGTKEAGDHCWRKEDWAGASEWREWYKSYFRLLHPEEQPEELRGVVIP